MTGSGASVIETAKSETCGVNVYVCPVAGFVPMLLVSVVVLTDGFVPELFNEIKLPLCVPVAVSPIEAPNEALNTGLAS